MKLRFDGQKAVFLSTLSVAVKGALLKGLLSEEDSTFYRPVSLVEDGTFYRSVSLKALMDLIPIYEDGDFYVLIEMDVKDSENPKPVFPEAPQ